MPETPRQRDAFARLVRLPGKRSLRQLHEVLAADGWTISRRTLEKWSTKGRWQERLAEYDRRVADRDRERYVAERQALGERRRKVGRFLQMTALATIKDPTSPAADRRHALRELEVGFRLEEEGLPGDGRTEVVEVRELHAHLGGPKELYMFPDPDQPAPPAVPGPDFDAARAD